MGLWRSVLRHRPCCCPGVMTGYVRVDTQQHARFAPCIKHSWSVPILRASACGRSRPFECNGRAVRPDSMGVTYKATEANLY